MTTAPERRTAATSAAREAFVDRRVTMIGIGGCGMSGLARMLSARGARIRGVDREASATVSALRAEGVDVALESECTALADECDLVVASAAIRPEHPLMVDATQRGIATMTYAEALGLCMEGRTGIAVAGTHGKSTTAAMLGAALVDAGLDPTVIVGATCAQLSRGSLATPEGATPVGFRLGAATVPEGKRAGSPGVLVAEACEFNRSFHCLRPTIASISSVEADHLDVYGTLDGVVESFSEFARLVAPASDGGVLLIAHDGAHRTTVTRGASATVETIGFSPEADWVVGVDRAARRVTLTRQGQRVCAWTMRLPGMHNAMNSATACALAILAGAEPAVVGRSLSAFRGLDRRAQLLGERAVPGGGSVRVYDDYGHHPTEVDATLRALREFERPQDRGGRLICVFQPHQHSRTRHLLAEFAAAFSSADVVIVPHIYFVRDSEIEKHRVSSADLVDRLRSGGVKAMHLYPFEAIVEQLENVCRAGDLLVVMGAGPVWQVAHGFLDAGARQADASPARTSTRGGVHIHREAPIPTWFGVGGSADRLAHPVDEEELAECLAIDPSLLVLGEGANLLVDDRGVDRLVVVLDQPWWKRIAWDERSGVVVAGAGADLRKLAAEAARRGLSGLEGLGGIPATVGGAVVMNAGGAFGSIADVVARVDAIDRSGRPVTLERDQVAFDYRRSGLESLIITGVHLRLAPGETDAVRGRLKQVLSYKGASQPLGERSGGCCFKNPVLGRSVEGVGSAGDRVSAGLLLDRAGCKGMRAGGASVSELHANFVVARDGATAGDVITLMERMQERVRERFGVELAREVVVWRREA